MIIFHASDVNEQEIKNGLHGWDCGYQLRASARKDGLAWINTTWFAITDQSHEIELEWDASQSAGIDNGQLRFFIDSIQRTDLTGIDNDTFRVDRVCLGAVSGIDTTTRGVCSFDS
jgi:hypothetical protein